jgi:hypothetical protein
MDVNDRLHTSAVLPAGNHGTHCIGGWVTPRAGHDAMEKIDYHYHLQGIFVSICPSEKLHLLKEEHCASPQKRQPRTVEHDAYAVCACFKRKEKT